MVLFVFTAINLLKDGLPYLEVVIYTVFAVVKNFSEVGNGGACP